MLDCPHGGPWKTVGGMHQRTCALVAELSGYARVYITESRCGQCSGKDDGTHASKAATSLLGVRVGAEWDDQAACATCGGSQISLDEAVKRLKARNAKMAEDAVVAAVTHGGMPKERAYDLAVKHCPGDAALEKRIDAAIEGGTAGKPCIDCEDKAKET